MTELAGPDHLAALQDELRYLLNRWDPIGVYDESLNIPPDEYDYMLAPLLARLARNDTRADLSEYLWHEIEDHFGLDPYGCGTDAFADHFLAWYAAKNRRKQCAGVVLEALQAGCMMSPGSPMSGSGLTRSR